MADPVFVTTYRDEHIAAFEQNYSLLRACCVQEAVIKGNQAVFLVSGSGGATAVTRGSNGLIPYGSTDNTQNTCTLLEKHAPFERTGFNIFASQGDQKRIMQMGSVAVLNRDIDQTIIDQLDTATQTTGTATTADINMVMKALVILGNNEVDTANEDAMFGVITPAFRAYLQQTTEFSSGDYVEVKPYNGPARRMFRWSGVNWMVHPNLTGVGTSAEKCYLFHRDAMGHAANSKEMEVAVGYDEKQAISWSRATLYHGAKLLQNTGVVQMLHDGSAYVAS
jgi:hypothetical protein